MRLTSSFLFLSIALAILSLPPQVLSGPRGQQLAQYSEEDEPQDWNEILASYKNNELYTLTTFKSDSES